jgi:hypothetical protein
MSRAARITGRLVRRFTLGSGPLKRRTDRLQLFARVLLLAAALAAVPVALFVATTLRSHLTGLAAEQARGRHQVQAVLTQEATRPFSPAPVWSPGIPRTMAQARWAGPDGTTRYGTVLSPLGAHAGQQMPVWVTADGTPAAAPLSRQGVAEEAAVAGLGSFLGLVLTAVAGYALVCRRLDRHRDRQWTEGWAAVAPIWTARLR